MLVNLATVGFARAILSNSPLGEARRPTRRTLKRGARAKCDVCGGPRTWNKQTCVTAADAEPGTPWAAGEATAAKAAH
jgi:hypothetical protein